MKKYYIIINLKTGLYLVGMSIWEWTDIHKNNGSFGTWPTEESALEWLNCIKTEGVYQIQPIYIKH